MKWNDLKENPPTGKEYAVILFPCKTDCGLLYTTSNPQYAVKHGTASGYTHWAEIELAPTHEYWSEWQDNVTPEENKKSLERAVEYLQSLEPTQSEEVLFRRREAGIRMAEAFRKNADRNGTAG